ncbi:flap endonuclease-1 [Candidatus Woesearchaeota archaeon]|nr:flap endonuclease-1 [Candidatus Woesearchaeota archaeon]
MGIAFKDLIKGKEISLEDLSGKKLMIDAHNNLYQYLTTIRQRDGTPLMDSKGRVTSHLVGVFNRTTRLMQSNIMPAFVFDGEAPELKKKERERRKASKIEAQKKYEDAVKKEDTEAMKKYASRTSRLTSDIIEESKKIIDALGLPIIQAPSEGEAQAAHIVKKGEAFATVSQDFDTLLYGTQKLVKNLSIAGKRKKAGTSIYQTISPEIIDLTETLNALGIDNNQLIALAMLVGTDYNREGVKGIGPKNALKLVKKHGADFDNLFEEVKWKEHFELPWTDVYYLFKKMPVTDDYKLEWKQPDWEKLSKLLVEEHDFSQARVNSAKEKLTKNKESKQQKGLGEFFK